MFMSKYRYINIENWNIKSKRKKKSIHKSIS